MYQLFHSKKKKKKVRADIFPYQLIYTFDI